MKVIMLQEAVIFTWIGLVHDACNDYLGQLSSVGNVVAYWGPHT